MNKNLIQRITDDIGKSYTPGYVHPDFVSYVRSPRIVPGLRFRLQHQDDPAPDGFIKMPNGICFKPPTGLNDNGIKPYNPGETFKLNHVRTPVTTFDNIHTNPFTGHQFMDMYSRPSKVTGKYVESSSTIF